MTSGPVVVSVFLKAKMQFLLTAKSWRSATTNPKEAAPGTIRADFAVSIDENAAHGSDSVASAEREIAYFFAETRSAHALVNPKYSNQISGILSGFFIVKNFCNIY